MVRIGTSSRGLTASTIVVFAIGWLGPGDWASAQARREVSTFPSGDRQITVECFAPATPGKYPAVILLHGSGGLEEATGDVFRGIASSLATHGYVAFIPHYFEKTDHPLGRPLQQGEREAWLDLLDDLVEFAAKQPEIDPTRFAMLGYSMGSGLAMSRAIRDPRIKAVVSCSGAYPPVKPNKKLPPLLILHGSKDSGTPLEYVKKYVAALQEQEMPCEVHVYTGLGHNFDSNRFNDASRRALAFFDKHVKPQPVRKR